MSCPSVLHPSQKLEYFKQADWEPPWIATAKTLVYTRFNESYKDQFVAVNESGDEEDEPKEGAIAVNGVRVVGVDDAATDGLGASFGGMSISPIGNVMSSLPLSVA